MWYRFGTPAIFFTISPCDECNFQIRVFASSDEHQLPDWQCSKEECIAEWIYRSEVRMKYPGACALDFLNIIDIVIEHLLGWDEERGCPFDHGGIFGKLQAFSMAVEEQGRKTLHAHFILWVHEFNDLLETIQNPRRERDRDRAITLLQEYIDASLTTELYGMVNNDDHLKCPFEHSPSCTTTPMPSGVSDDDLRKMRHKIGAQESEGIIAKCELCGKTYQSEGMMVEDLHALGLPPEISNIPDDTHRMDILALRHIYDFTGSSPTWQQTLQKSDWCTF